jgi:hypothetical protein
MVSGSAVNTEGDRELAEEAMAPTDYFMGLFVGVCVGLAGLAYVNAAAPGTSCHIDNLVMCCRALSGRPSL